MSWRDGGRYDDKSHVPDAATDGAGMSLERTTYGFKDVTPLAGVSAPQPRPKGGGVDITAAVVADLQERSRVGRQKYDDVLRSHNGRDAMMDAYQEVLDLACYFRQLIEERPK